MSHSSVAALVLLLCLGCGGEGQTVISGEIPTTPDSSGADADTAVPNSDAAADLLERESAGTPDESGLDSGGLDLPEGCEPGAGCFMEKCEEGSDCLSGWCLDHMGDGVCSQECSEDCPQGWDCRQVTGSGRDVAFVCVSTHANLCRPCSNGNDCQSEGGAEDACVDYGDEGSFCGGKCEATLECPWGFTCKKVPSIDGIESMQCVADAGVCPCTAKSVELGLWTPCQVSNEWGQCEGKRICTADGLAECDAAVPQKEECDGVDQDCDGETDESLEVEGKHIDLCDDGNACTEDSCVAEAGCQHDALDEVECIDGDPCTIADVCSAGVCAGSKVDCDDENPCTDDSCDNKGGCVFAANALTCDDGDPCTVADQCKDKECVAFQMACDCLTDDDCASLEDGDLCNGTLVCNTSKLPHQCVVDGETAIACPQPAGAHAPCQEAQCDPLSGGCSFVAAHDGAPCDDQDPCTVADTCSAGSCAAGPAANCNDGNPCTDDSCQVGAGCVNKPSSSTCSDADVCTTNDLCIQGECVGGKPLECDDGNPCTDDSCDGKTGCSHSANQDPCDDGNECTVGDQCAAGMCVAGAYSDCDDANVCTDDYCDPVQGCVHSVNEAHCNDGSLCTTNDHCSLGNCTGGGFLNCKDGNPCTDDTCHPDTGCVFKANTSQCNDANQCTLGDSCSAGACMPGAPVSCDDGDPCTSDTCDPKTGCAHPPNMAPCDDGNVCTTSDKCAAGKCVAGPALKCDDGNPCTDDSCDPIAGCAHAPNKVPCNDGNACTTGETCANGMCSGAQIVACDDGNVCTTDSCDDLLGCVFENNTLPCDDGDACTPDDVCNKSACTGTGELACNDGSKCTTDSCEPASGCEFKPITPCCGNGVVEPGEQCDDGNQADGDECHNDCTPGVGCSAQAEYHKQVVPGVWACVNNKLITTYEENNAMCAAGFTPATYKLVQALPFPTLAEHQAYAAWYVQHNGGEPYIRTGQKRRGGCSPEAHGDVYIHASDSGWTSGSGGWRDLYYGGSSCNSQTDAANNMSHPLPGVICVKGVYEPPAP